MTPEQMEMIKFGVLIAMLCIGYCFLQFADWMKRQR